MRPALTDIAMLRAAERRLADHLRLRPSTAADRAAIVAAESERADKLAAAAAQLRAAPSLDAAGRVAAVGRGAQCVALQHDEGRDACHRVRAAMELDRLAAIHRMRADAWRAATDATYEATAAEYRARVDYYRARIGGAS